MLAQCQRERETASEHMGVTGGRSDGQRSEGNTESRRKRFFMLTDRKPDKQNPAR